jgi:hypothetical protein
VEARRPLPGVLPVAGHEGALPLLLMKPSVARSALALCRPGDVPGVWSRLLARFVSFRFVFLCAVHVLYIRLHRSRILCVFCQSFSQIWRNCHQKCS